MSHQQVPQHVTQSQQANSPQLESPPQVVIAQPTVRVMRLYKPCMHIIPTIPREIESGARKNADFAVSPFLLLPDNFGDIYTGELFSAYIQSSMVIKIAFLLKSRYLCDYRQRMLHMTY